jgi:hypothetical protein
MALARHRVMQPDPVPDSITVHPGWMFSLDTTTAESTSSTICVRECTARPHSSGVGFSATIQPDEDREAMRDPTVLPMKSS